MPMFILHHIKPNQSQVDNIEHGNADAIATGMIDAMLSGSVSAAMKHDLYEPVAVLECERVDDIFPITNHVDADWSTNAGVIATDALVRSTSVGDVAYDLDAEAAWSCATVGWKRIEDTEILDRLKSASVDYAQHHGVQPETS